MIESQRINRRSALRVLGAGGALSAVGAAALTGSPTGQGVNSNQLARKLAMIQADRNEKWKGSPLGSLYPFIKKMQDEAPQSMAFLKVRPKDLEAWKAEARTKVFDLLLYRPKPCDPQARILEKVDKGDYIREYLHFHTTPDIEVPAYFLYPKRAKFPVPAVVALHDHSGFYYYGKEKIVEIEHENPVVTAFRQRRYDGLSFPITLARHGYAVMVTDMYYFGERRLVLDSDLAQGINTWSKVESAEVVDKINQRNGDDEWLVNRNLQDVGITWAGVTCWDDIRTIDYLATRPEVDIKRVACTGLSVGGWRTNFLAGLDPRIKAACIAGWMTSFHEIVPWFVKYTIWAGNVPGLFKYLDYPDVGLLTMPNPLMVINGTEDPLFPPNGVKAAYRNLARCYEAIGKPERFTTYTYDGPHKFPARAQQLMMDWFDRWV
ncbi:MAG: dienelactone hydrolase family protein [Terriglobia bacterium]